MSSPLAALTHRLFRQMRLVNRMRILFDQGVPRELAASLRTHEVAEARELGWEPISNGASLKVAEGAGFDLLLTTDKNVRYQQNLSGRKIALVVLGPIALVACPAAS